MLKRLLITFVFLFPLAIQAQNFDKGVLWEIHSASGKTSYLLGTMHSDDERILNLPAPVRKAFKQSKSFTAEAMMDLNTIMTMSQAMYYADGTQLKKLIGDKRYKASAKYLAEYGVPEMMVAAMKPWAVATTLSMPKPKTGKFLDMMLYKQALDEGKAVHGLETAQEQVDVLDTMPVKQQVSMLDEAIENYHRMPVLMEKLLKIYLDRDLKGMLNINDEFMAESDKKVAEHIEKQLIVKRNHRMAERMQARLKEGKAFIAIGALHLPGDEGVLNLLVKQGYKVKPLY